jgi:hypothetical protein
VHSFRLMINKFVGERWEPNRSHLEVMKSYGPKLLPIRGLLVVDPK